MVKIKRPWAFKVGVFSLLLTLGDSMAVEYYNAMFKYGGGSHTVMEHWWFRLINFWAAIVFVLLILIGVSLLVYSLGVLDD